LIKGGSPFQHRGARLYTRITYYFFCAIPLASWRHSSVLNTPSLPAFLPSVLGTRRLPPVSHNRSFWHASHHSLSRRASPPPNRAPIAGFSLRRISSVQPRHSSLFSLCLLYYPRFVRSSLAQQDNCNNNPSSQHPRFYFQFIY
jgi:hypothetical protein